jgi:hypothetical protein
MRERFPVLRLCADLDAIVDGCCGAWDCLTATTVFAHPAGLDWGGDPG